MLGLNLNNSPGTNGTQRGMDFIPGGKELAQRGMGFIPKGIDPAQRGMDFIPGGIVYSLFSSRYGEIEFEYNKDDKNKL
jgi:hypothetical protein